jgi:L-asparagine transporter-like permease
LIVFSLITAGHLKVRRETGAPAWLLILSVLSSAIALITFALTTLVDEPGTAIAMLVVLAISVVIGLIWKRRRAKTEEPLGA